jgi:predicted nucleic acid-binding protein
MGAIVDTGPLVAFFDRSERHHDWAVEQIETFEAPLLVCEPVLTEASYLLSRFPKAHETLLELVEEGALLVAFSVQDNIAELRSLVRKYRDVPMSLADACIVRMAQIFPSHLILTLDSDFMIYRKQGRIPLNIVHPA